MSTRATVHFESVQTTRYDHEKKEVVTLDEPVVHTHAIVYRHSDGYPEGLGQDLVRFIAEVSHLSDTRLSDPSYLAAKWVVFDVLEYQAYMHKSNAEQEKRGERPYYPDIPRLAFLGVGIVQEDPGDIEYRYHVMCDGKVDAIHYEGVNWHNDKGVISTHVEEPA